MGNLSHLLRESWTLVEERRDHVAGYFHARIFLVHPQLRELFPVHLDVRRPGLLDAIVNAIQALDDPERFREHLHALGRDHRKFRVSRAHYDAIGAALLESLRAFAGERWSAEYDRVWSDAYREMATKMIEGAEADTNPPFWHAEVVRHERRTPEIAVFTCRPMSPLEYVAGQRISLECRYRPRLWRAYSIANAPREDGSLTFHIRSARTGWVSDALVRQLRAGDVIRLGSPMGSMTLDRRSSRDIVFVAGGTGLAPLKALTEELTRYNRTRWVHLFLGARDRCDLYDLADLTRMAGRYPWLSVVPAVHDDPSFPGEQGEIAEVVARYGPWAEHDFFVCGPRAMVRETRQRLAGLQVPAERVRYDSVADG
jgi:NAD(P)H-flavin reductase/hemoglobin-like flavoprotein